MNKLAKSPFHRFTKGIPRPSIPAKNRPGTAGNDARLVRPGHLHPASSRTVHKASTSGSRHGIFHSSAEIPCELLRSIRTGSLAGRSSSALRRLRSRIQIANQSRGGPGPLRAMLPLACVVRDAAVDSGVLCSVRIGTCGWLRLRQRRGHGARGLLCPADPPVRRCGTLHAELPAGSAVFIAAMIMTSGRSRGSRADRNPRSPESPLVSSLRFHLLCTRWESSSGSFRRC